MAFPTGAYDPAGLPGPLRRFCPTRSAGSLYEIEPEELARRGKRLVMLDADNTLLPWRSMEIPDETREWVARCKGAGLDVCILSNTRHPKRLTQIASELGIAFFRGKFKPNPSIYLEALKHFGRGPKEAVMIGDQIFTDMWGANRAGVEGIWVKPSTSRDFIGTKVSRMGERLLKPYLSRAITMESPTTTPIQQPSEAASALWERPIVRQFMKFAVVGGSSTVIDVGLHWLLMFGIHVDGRPLGQVFGETLIAGIPTVFQFAKDAPAAAVPVFKIVSASIAIVNSFIWNRRWTFRIEGPEEWGRHFRKFVIVALTGMALNTLITTGFNNVIPGHALRSWGIATAIATVMVAFWNFAGQKFWAFREPER